MELLLMLISQNYLSHVNKSSLELESNKYKEENAYDSTPNNFLMYSYQLCVCV